MILIQKTQIDMVIIFIVAVYLIQFRKMNPVLVMVLSGVAKLGIYLVGLPFANGVLNSYGNFTKMRG